MRSRAGGIVVLALWLAVLAALVLAESPIRSWAWTVFLAVGAGLAVVLAVCYCLPLPRYGAPVLYLAAGVGAGLFMNRLGMTGAEMALVLAVVFLLLGAVAAGRRQQFLNRMTMANLQYRRDGRWAPYLDELDRGRRQPESRKLLVAVPELGRNIRYREMMDIWRLTPLRAAGREDAYRALRARLEARWGAAGIEAVLRVVPQPEPGGPEAAFAEAFPGFGGAETPAAGETPPRPAWAPADARPCPACGGRVYVARAQPDGSTRSVRCAACNGQGWVAADGGVLTPPKVRGRGERPWPLLFPLLAMILAFGLLWLALSPWCQRLLMEDAETPLALLQGCADWYLWVILAAVGGLVVMIAGCLAAGGGQALKLEIVLLGLYVLVAGAMLFVEDVPGLLDEAREDIAQIQQYELASAQVFLSPKVRDAHLPGLAGDDGFPALDRYGGIGEDTDRAWVHFYVPDCLGFSLDEGALYDENRSIQWNEANARQYRLLYTTNFHLVVEVLPQPLPGEP